MLAFLKAVEKKVVELEHWPTVMQTPMVFKLTFYSLKLPNPFCNSSLYHDTVTSFIAIYIPIHVALENCPKP
jgi:hypothetical protein